MLVWPPHAPADVSLPVLAAPCVAVRGGREGSVIRTRLGDNQCRGAPSPPASSAGRRTDGVNHGKMRALPYTSPLPMGARRRVVALLSAWMWLYAGSVALANPRALAPDAPRAVAAPPMPLHGVPGPMLRGELAVAAVDVGLTIHRAGERLPDGTRVDGNGAHVAGVATYTLDRPAAPGERLTLLDFAGSMREEPRHLDEVTLGSYVDGPFDAGGMTIAGVWGTDTVQRVGARRDLVISLPVGATSFTLRYSIDVPHRYWPFGCVRRRCSLSGALAPLPSTPAKGGVYLPAGGRVVAPARWHLRAAFATPADIPPGTAPHRRARVPDQLIVAGGRGEVTAYPSVFFGRRWHETTELRRGVRVQVYTPQPRPSGQVPDETALQLRPDVAGNVLGTFAELVELMGVLGRPPPIDTDLVVVQGPLRAQIAEAHPGAVIVSDQAFALFPLERFRRFHEDAIARGIAQALVHDTMRGSHDPSTDLWLGGAVAYAMVQLWRATHRSRDEFAHDILSRFTFVPAVDRFLYTQQASFSSAYFRGVEDEMPVRNHPLWFAHQLPTGRRIHEELADILGGAGLDGFYRRLLAAPSRDPVRLAESVWGRQLDWFFAQWLGPYPEVDYAIVDVDSRRGDAAEGGWDHRITIAKDSAVPLVEPVQVLVTERGGERHHLTWNGELGNTGSLADEPTAGRKIFTLHTRAKIASVRLDPRSRTLQTARAPRDNVDPLFNDRTPKSFRFLYTGVGLSIAASEFVSAATATARFNAIAGFALFESSLRRDLRRTGHVQIARDRETDIALGAGTNLWFGRKVNRQRRRARVRLFETIALLNGRSLDPRGGLRLVESIAVADDTRAFGWWPERGRSLAISISARHTLRTEGRRDHRHDLEIDAGWVQLWRLAKDHVIATSVYAELIRPLVGSSEFRALSRVGGISGLSGYSADEAFGMAVASLQAEYRHVFVNDLRPNFAHVAWLRSIGGIAFAGASTASPCDRLAGWFGARSWYGTVGYALTGYLSILGVTPQLIRVEVAAPLVRYRNEQCLGQRFPDYLGRVQGLTGVAPLLPPVSFNVTFQQSF